MDTSELDQVRTFSPTGYDSRREGIINNVSSSETIDPHPESHAAHTSNLKQTPIKTPPARGFTNKVVDALATLLNPYSEYIAECIGTMMLITIGGSSVAQSNYSCFLNRDPAALSSDISGLKCSPPVSSPNVHFAWGLAVMLGVYTASSRSAAHLNPAVTFVNCLFSGFGWVKGCFYMLSQLLGAFLGAIAVVLVYYGAYDTLKTSGLPTAGKFVSNLATGPLFASSDAFSNNVIHYIISEVTGSAILLVAILAISEHVGSSKTLACIAPFLIGLSVTAIGMSLGLLTGYAINPARDFGPRLAAYIIEPKVSVFNSENNYFLIPLFSPFIGAVIGALIYKVISPPKTPDSSLRPSDNKGGI